uniref:Uncharacterized protein n=1 Tax=Ditylenchus dipsaci TaxID=166011 RepID=A0A915CU48_9BILA
MSGLDESIFSSKFSESSASATELQDLHVRLQEELISLQITESRLHQELEGMRKKQMEIKESGHDVDLDSYKEEMAAKQGESQEKSHRLKEIISREEVENDNLRQQIETTEQKLAQNSLYSKLKELKKYRVDVAEEEKRILKEKVDAQVAKNDYEPLKQEALRLRVEYNNALVQSFSNVSSTLR